VATVYGPASPAQVAAATSRPRRRHTWIGAVAFLFVGMIILNGIAQASQPSTGCRHNCGSPPPPTSPPESFSATYRSSSLGFALAYDPSYAGSPTSSGSASVSWEFPLKSGGYLDARIFGSRADGETPDQAVSSIQSASFSQFQGIYAIPNAEVGYVAGSGEIYQGQWTPMMGSSSTERLAILAATKKDVTVTVICEAPKVADNGAHADPAELGIGADQFCDQVMNTVTWAGERPQ